MTDRPSKWKVGLTAGRLAGRRLLRRKDSERDEKLGEILTGQLDEMKGLAMKLGQIVSYMDVPLPESAQKKLAELQTGLNGLSEAETRAALVDALGSDFESRFEAFDPHPIAAASIGQVHRARVDGQDIALKLRYPGIADSFEQDLGGVGKIAALARVVSVVDGGAIVRELGDRLSEECDYIREAAFQQAFGQAFADDVEVVIPEVIRSLSTEATLATAWSDGEPFAVAREQPQETRNEYAEILVRFAYRCLFNLAAIQADPHPGNYLFGPGSSVVFLDFGCVRQFEAQFVGLLRAMVETIIRGDRPGFRQVIIDLDIAPNPKKFDFDHHFEMMEHVHRPLIRDSFTFTSAYAKQGFAYSGPANPNARTMNMPPPYMWVARLQMGLWSVLARLGATVSFRPTLDSILDAPVEPLAYIK